MARKYKFNDQSELYFVTFTVVNWIDIFVRDSYREIFISSVTYCQQNKGLLVHAWVIMPSHVHLIISRNGEPLLQDIVRDLKSFTSRHIRKELEQATYESRKDWLLSTLGFIGRTNRNNKDWQFWQQDNHPIQLSNGEMLQQRLNYLHNNPVTAGFVVLPEHWRWSSANDYAGGSMGAVDIAILDF